MPLYTDTSLYSQSVPSYALYLSSPYSGHSSLISSYTRPTFSKPLSRFNRNFAPHLATISENPVISLRRKYSPQIRISTPKYSAPRPIKINTADIDVSANKYRQQTIGKPPEKEDTVKNEEAKPIRRDRATVRLHTFHKDNKGKKWRQNFNSFELNSDSTKKSPEEENVTEEVQLPKSPSFHDICRAISTDSINEKLNPGQPNEVVRKQSRTFSNEDFQNLKNLRRNSFEPENDETPNEDINNNDLKRSVKPEGTFESRGSVRKRKKVVKKKSQDLDSVQTEENPPTQSTLQRRNTKKSSFKDISKVEVEEIRNKPKPIFTATVNIEQPKPSLKVIIDDVKVEEKPKAKPKRFKLNVTVQVEEKPKLKKKIEDKGKMYIPNSKPALVTDIKKKEQRGSLGDICEGIEEMPKRRSSGDNRERKEDNRDNKEEISSEKKEIIENILGSKDNKVEIKENKTEINENKIGLNKKEINKNIKETIRENKTVDDKDQEINSNEIIKNKEDVEINKNKEEIYNKNIEINKIDSENLINNTDLSLNNKLGLEDKTEKFGNKLVGEKKEEMLKRDDKKLIEESPKSTIGELKKETPLKGNLELKCDTIKEEEIEPKYNQKESPKVEKTIPKWKQDLKRDSPKEEKIKPNFKVKVNQKESSDSLKENNKSSFSPKVESKEEKIIPKWKQDLKRDSPNAEKIKPSFKVKENSDSLKENNKPDLSPKVESKEEKTIPKWKQDLKRDSPKAEKIKPAFKVKLNQKEIESKEEKTIPKWKQDLKKAQQEKQEIKSIMKGNKQDGNRNYKKSVSIEENQIREEDEGKDFWDLIGTRSSVYEKKPMEVKTVPITKEVEEEQKEDENAEEENKEVVAPLKLVSKRSLVNKATNEDSDLQVFVPPPKPPTPEPQPESFVPLQSNRLSNWMHPFKKPEQFDECPVEIFATPKNIRRRHFPKPRNVAVQEEESDSEETSSEDEDSSEEDGNVGKSTSSNDSGFNSSNGYRKDQDCDVNIHRKCEKLTANLCGINQKLIVEAIESVKRGSSDTRDSPTSNPAHNPAFALDPCDVLEEFQTSSTYASFQKSGRITPPATTIPRFRKYTIDDFNFLKVLGKGSFGKVLLAELKDTEYYYAIKCLKKDVVLEDDDVECTLIERKVLALGTKHPYLCHLLCTFQTESHLFFVMEYLNGGDLMFHIQQSGRFPEARARFYGAEIVSGLKFLHSKGIVYRDLKLDNVLLDFDGHVRIADFGMCKLQIFLDRMADTFCGTPDYMAPEIIKGQHYNQCVDWWSFGVLLYEMLIGQSPFSGCDEDELFWSICNEKPVFPRFLSGEANSVLTHLLEKDWNKRLGNKLSPHGDIQDHAFFRPISWDLLEMRHLDAPFKPNLQHPLDTQYFDKTFTVEKAKLTPIEKNILQSMDQTQFQGFSYTNPNATDR